MSDIDGYCSPYTVWTIIFMKAESFGPLTAIITFQCNGKYTFSSWLNAENIDASSSHLTLKSAPFA